jgi:NAD(P)-dependent dehydrogenase (short-subunit alcohol dehydrogenase family)
MTRIALITGGSRGLGRASARALADDGTDIIVTYRSNPEEANAVAAELSGRGRTAILPLDVTDHDSFPAWTPTGFVDTIRTGTMVYEERTGSGTGAQEVHPGI